MDKIAPEVLSFLLDENSTFSDSAEVNKEFLERKLNDEAREEASNYFIEKMLSDMGESSICKAWDKFKRLNNI